MAAVTTKSGVGPLVREWRERRRLTQLELALDAGISARHLSFVETGRSTPSPEMVLRIAEQLQVPFRERNRMLLAAGHAPAFPERSLADPELAPVRVALDRILTAHDPYPAVVFDSAWNAVAVNSGVLPLIEGADPALLEPPVNVLRLGLHLADGIVNGEQVLTFVRERLARQIAVAGNDDLVALAEELAAHQPPERAGEPSSDPRGGDFLGPVRMRGPDRAELAFFGMFAGFDTPFEVTTSELAMELLFPADRATAEALERPSPRTEGGALWL